MCYLTSGRVQVEFHSIMASTNVIKIKIVCDCNIIGPRFDVREFHSLVLNNGPVPLRVLEKLVDDWIHSGQGHSFHPVG